MGPQVREVERKGKLESEKVLKVVCYHQGQPLWYSEKGGSNMRKRGSVLATWVPTPRWAEKEKWNQTEDRKHIKHNFYLLHKLALYGPYQNETLVSKELEHVSLESNTGHTSIIGEPVSQNASLGNASSRERVKQHRGTHQIALTVR